MSRIAHVMVYRYDELSDKAKNYAFEELSSDWPDSDWLEIQIEIIQEAGIFVDDVDLEERYCIVDFDGMPYEDVAKRLREEWSGELHDIGVAWSGGDLQEAVGEAVLNMFLSEYDRITSRENMEQELREFEFTVDGRRFTCIEETI